MGMDGASYGAFVSDAPQGTYVGTTLSPRRRDRTS
jgi:hypothetical protein